MQDVVKRCLGALAVVGVCVALTAPASATLMMSVQDDANPAILIVDNGVGDVDVTLGVIQVNAASLGGLANWVTVNISAAVSPIIQPLNSIDVSGQVINSTANASIYVSAWETFSGGTGGTLYAGIGGTVGPTGVLSAEAYKQFANGVAGPIVLGPFGFGIFSDEDTADYDLVGQYTFVQNILVEHGTVGTSSSWNFSATNPVPEPSTAMLALAGLPLLGIGAWMRKRRAR